MKKIVIVLGCIWILCSCNGRGRPGTGIGPAQIDRSNFNTLGTYPLVKDKETLNVLVLANGNGKNWEDNWLTGFYEAKTNVHINWFVAPIEQFKEKVNLAFASGDQLDLILAGNNSQTSFKQSELMNMANQKLILPIQDYIDSDTVELKKNLPTYEGWRQVMTNPEGDIYGLPNLVEAFHGQYSGKLWVNMVFLKNLNLRVPTTIDEFHDMLTAFKTRDANGNGDPNDEIPLMGAIDNFGGKVDTFLMSAFIYDDGENRLWINDDGKVVASYREPEFRQGLRTLHQWFTEGLIHKDSFITMRPARAQLNSQKYESIIGVIPNIHHGNLGTRDTDQPVRWIDYEPIPPLKGPNGLQITRYDYYDKFMTSGGSRGVIPSTCRNPALVMRWLDWFGTEEGTLAAYWGGENISWITADTGSVGEDGRPAKYKRLQIQPEDKYFQNASWGLVPLYQTQDFRSSLQSLPSADADPRAPDGSGVERFLYIKTRENYAPYGIKPANQIPPLFYSREDTSAMVSFTANINTYVEESIAKFIVGDMNIETDWNTFQQTLNRLGVERYLKIIQDTYDRSSFKKID